MTNGDEVIGKKGRQRRREGEGHSRAMACSHGTAKKRRAGRGHNEGRAATQGAAWRGLLYTSADVVHCETRISSACVQLDSRPPHISEDRGRALRFPNDVRQSREAEAGHQRGTDGCERIRAPHTTPRRGESDAQGRRDEMELCCTTQDQQQLP